ncbi:spore germination protein KA [Paenibacillus endophyticus]|uniref:Spore germination protein KA n=2 Tax=Paenibacillus endophyticus TaxID=1294268 RepID=A0A7W5CDX3_9BACL|nr:spore germination protein [Paenibacillus endophyticus]MBB3155893.1 spore germination protein KA [Paenibacillus endophyticus]
MSFEETNHDKLTADLSTNVQQIKAHLGNSSDVTIREFTVPINRGAVIVYLNNLVNKELVHSIMKSIFELLKTYSEKNTKINIPSLSYICKNLLVVSEPIIISELSELHNAILSGHTFLHFDGMAEGLAIDTAKIEKRNVTVPVSQNVIRGPQEAFTESSETNLSLIRKKIKNQNLWCESKFIGDISKTKIEVMFIKGIADEKIIHSILKRLDSIKIEGVFEGNYIEELIQDNNNTLFPTVYNTERPDVVAAALLEGRVSIIVDGTPFVLLAPALFTTFIQSAEDYYHKDYGFTRLLRFFAFFITLLSPSIFISLVTYHQEMLPTPLLINLASQRESTPFPAYIEALFLETVFELLREASIRMPKAIGSPISIVGALILGQSAVEAGLVSTGMVIVVALTAISGFTLPSVEIGIPIRILRFIFMGAAAVFGFFGVMAMIIVTILHLCHLESFGIPYMSPFAPFKLKSQKDNLIRMPWWRMHYKPDSYRRQYITEKKINTEEEYIKHRKESPS